MGSEVVRRAWKRDLPACKAEPCRTEGAEGLYYSRPPSLNHWHPRSWRKKQHSEFLSLHSMPPSRHFRSCAVVVVSNVPGPLGDSPALSRTPHCRICLRKGQHQRRQQPERVPAGWPGLAVGEVVHRMHLTFHQRAPTIQRLVGEAICVTLA